MSTSSNNNDFIAALAAAADPAATANSPLFQLSGEIRNRIYRFALLSDTVPNVGPSFAEPGLLKTSKLIRAESMTIFYCEAKFHLQLTNNDCAPAIRWERKANALLPLVHRTRKNLVISRHWENLVDWLEQYRQRQVISRVGSPLNLVVKTSNTVENLVVGALFDMASEGGALTPQAFEAMLDSQRVILGLHDRDWLIDHD